MSLDELTGELLCKLAMSVCISQIR